MLQGEQHGVVCSGKDSVGLEMDGKALAGTDSEGMARDSEGKGRARKAHDITFSIACKQIEQRCLETGAASSVVARVAGGEGRSSHSVTTLSETNATTRSFRARY